MGEWSEYFEDFPEENPANWVKGEFNPRLAQEVPRLCSSKSIPRLSPLQARQRSDSYHYSYACC